MDYNHVTIFLEKFKKLLSQKEGSYITIAEVITKHIGSQVDVSKVKVKGTIIHIQGSPMFRNEIMIHKDRILADLQKSTPENNITDIR